MLDRNCLTWTDLSEFVTFYKICQCSGALDNFIHCGNPPSQVPTEAKYCPDSGGWWVVGGRCPECVHRRPQLSTSCPCQQCRSFGSQRWREYVSDFLVGGGTSVHDSRFFGFFLFSRWKMSLVFWKMLPLFFAQPQSISDPC